MGIEWLDEHSEEATRGIDLAVADMLSSLNKNNLATLKALANPGESLRFSELEKKTGKHPQQLNRDLAVLQRFSLIEKTEKEAYIITSFGKHVLGILSELSKYIPVKK